MKKLTNLALIILFFGLFSCDDSQDTSESSITDEPAEVSKDTIEVVPEIEKVTAIALWATTLREEPVLEKVNWVKGGAFEYGAKLELTGDTAIVGKTAFSKVKLTTGEEGWVKDYLIAKDAKVSVVIEPTSIFDNPSIMALDRDARLETGKIVVVVDDKDEIGFSKFYGKEKKIHGWIKTDSNISSEDIDIEVAILRKAALEEEDSAIQVMKIQEILENPSYMSSKLYADLASKVQGGDQQEILEDENEDMGVEFEEGVVPYEDESL